MKIAVLFGGCSPEHDVSLQSAHSVIAHMDRRKYEPVLIGITREGAWLHYTGEPEAIRQDTWHSLGKCARAVLSPERGTRGLLVFDGGGVREMALDAAFPVLHGKNGEDGTVQGLLELAGIPIAGCGSAASALCMDKYRAHTVVEAAGIRTPKAFTFRRGEAYAARAEALGYPLYVKPVRAGSSFGVARVADAAALPAAVENAFAYDGEVIVEENIEGFEVGCAVLGNGQLTVGEPDEVELDSGFFDYQEKYRPATSAIHVPARISRERANAVREAARVAYRALGCAGFARVDFFLTPEGGIVFNEVNTIPGFTAHSRYPGMMRAAGLSIDQVIDRVIALAVAR